MNKLKVGIIGLGVGEQHIHGFRQAGVEVAALCDYDPAKRRMAASKYPESTIYAHADHLLDDPSLHIVSIASLDNHHANQILKAINNGKHVFAEKPMCLTRAEAYDIQIALKRSDSLLRLSTNTILRMSPRFQDLRQRYIKGEFGKVFNIEADYNYGRIEKILNGWRGEIENYSVMLGGGIHLIDLMLWITQRKITEVYAIGNKFCSIGAEFVTPDMVSALLKFDNGMIGKISANFGCVMPHFHKFCLYGTKATYENALPDAKLYLSRDAHQQPVSINTPYPGVKKGALIPSFVEAIRGTGEAIVSENDVFSVLEICFAIDRSLQSGQPESIEVFNS